MVMTQEYNRQYVNLKSRIRRLRANIILSALNDTTLAVISHLDKIAKDLDMQYSDDRTLDGVEAAIEAFESKQLERA